MAMPKNISLTFQQKIKHPMHQCLISTIDSIIEISYFMPKKNWSLFEKNLIPSK